MIYRSEHLGEIVTLAVSAFISLFTSAINSMQAAQARAAVSRDAKERDYWLGKAAEYEAQAEQLRKKIDEEEKKQKTGTDNTKIAIAVGAALGLILMFSKGR